MNLLPININIVAKLPATGPGCGIVGTRNPRQARGRRQMCTCKVDKETACPLNLHSLTQIISRQS